MKFSETWLREWVDPPLITDRLVEQFTMAGLEVDSVEPAAPPLENIVVAQVTKVSAHPNADRLRVCEVDVGDKKSLQIVCGATNVVTGMRVPCALEGALLPGDFRIKRSKLRGVESMGMLCSAAELGLSENADGLMPLAEDAPIGAPFRDYLQLDDALIDIDLTPNRGDCLSVAGIAREAGVLNSLAVTSPAISPVAATIDETFPVLLDAPADCPRYVGRVIRDIDPMAQTPLWLQERLRRSGMRSLGPAVDVTNYVMLELGQPMHAFDLEQLQGAIHVRRAKVGEKLMLLNDDEVTLDESTLVIADENRLLAMAGIMGGEGSGVSESTKHIFLESAFFAPAVIAGRARAHGLATDSSHRFERGVDPQIQRMAVERASELLLQIVGGEPGPITETAVAENLPSIKQIELRRQRVARVLGIVIEPTRIEEILSRLGMNLQGTEEGWLVTPPSYRFDISIEEDLIEELIRIHGYADLPLTSIHSDQSIAARPEGQTDLQRIEGVLVERGYQEAITYSFVDPQLQRALDPEATAIELANPLSSEMSQMRTSLWPGLLAALQHNLNRQQERVRLFETGLRFCASADGIEQNPMLALAATGTVWEEQWAAKARLIDFFDLKSDMEALIGLTNRSDEFEFRAETHPALHPGQSARISVAGRAVGWIGLMHPRVSKEIDLKSATYLAEIELAALMERKVPVFAPLSKHPALRRDLAILVEEGVSAAEIITTARAAEAESLVNLRVFDLYRGKNLPNNQKSVALGLTLQHPSRTLTDTEVDDILEKVLNKLETTLGAKLRD